MPGSLRSVLDFHGIDFLDNTQGDWKDSSRHPGALIAFHASAKFPGLGIVEFSQTAKSTPETVIRSFELDAFIELTADEVEFSRYEARFNEEDFVLRVVSHNREYMEVLLQRFAPYIESFTVQDISPDWVEDE